MRFFSFSHTPFKYRITFCLSGLLLVSLGSVLLVTRHWMAQRGEQEIAFRVEQCEETLRRIHLIGKEKRMQPFKNMVVEPRFRALAEVRDINTLQHAADEVCRELGCAAFGFLSPSADVLGWDGIEWEAFSDTLEPLVVDQPETLSCTFFAEGRLIEMSLNGMRSNNKLNGYIAGGVEIDATILQEYEVAVGAPIDLFAGDQQMASSHQDPISMGRKRLIKVPIYGSLHFVVYLDTEAVTAPLWDAFRVMALISVCGVLIGGAISFWIASAFARPLHNLAVATRAVKEGNLAVRADVAGSPELRTLADNFNQMVDSVRVYQDTLEMSVCQLKEEIEEKTLHAQKLDNEIKQHKQTAIKLREAVHAAMAAAVARMEFLANMSHELRTPLNGIIGYAQMLIDRLPGELNKKQLKFMHTIASSGRHLLGLINDILDVAKIESGQADVAFSSIKINDTLDQVKNVIQPLVLEKDLTFEMDVDSRIEMIVADQQKLIQILCNLLGNAVKFTARGGRISLEVRRQFDAEDGKTPFADRMECASGEKSSRVESGIEFSVCDNGVGISVQDQKRIFLQFEQADSSYSRAQQGTGLGLALTKKMVELHKGTIRVESEGVAGRGSRFIVYIPYLNVQNQREKSRNLQVEGHHIDLFGDIQLQS